MNKIVIMCPLLAIIGCVETKKADVNNLLDLNDLAIDSSPVLSTAGNFTFGSEPEISFEWNDGKFNVVYDANRCSDAAKTFFDCMLPYLNSHIEEKAKELNNSNP